MINPDYNKVNEIVVDEFSEIYRVLNIPLLLGIIIRIYTNKIIIITPNVLVRDYLKEYSDVLRQHFNVDTIQFNVTRQPHDTPDNNPKIHKIDNTGSLYGFINPEYVDTPYIVSNSNKIAYAFANNLLEKREGAILYIYGETGTGKSHLLNVMAYNAIKSGHNVYISNTNYFIDYVKDSYFKNKNSFLALHKKIPFTILDDFQYLDKDELKWIAEPLFELLSQQVNYGNTIVISSDTRPSDIPAYFHDRVRNRLMNGYVAVISPPDDTIKLKYIEWYCSKNNIIVTKDISDYIVAVSKNIRTVKGMLGYCQVLSEGGPIDTRKFFELTNKVYGVDGILQDDTDTDKILYNKVLSILIKHYSITQSEINLIRNTNSKRKPKRLMLLDSIIWYLLRDRVKSSIVLKNILGLKHNTDKYYYRKGKEAYDTLSDQVKSDIDKLICNN